MLCACFIQLCVFVYISKETYLKVSLEFPDAIPSVSTTFTRFSLGLATHLI